MTDDEIIDELLATYEAFRRLGFRPDDIYFTVADSGQQIVGLTLQAQGRRFTVPPPAPPNSSPEDFTKKWVVAATRWNTLSQAEAQVIWDKSWISQHGAELVTKLIDKGFVLRPQKSAVVEA